MLQSSQLFQLTSSRREWREHPTQQRSRVMHFNSHPHEEDDEADCSSGVAAIVFQLTSSRRGWLVREAFIYYTSHFNSHPHEEDDNVHWWRCCISEISTHILTKRMTLYFKTLKVWYINFNSHPHEEDDDNILSYDTDMLFQLTSSRRGWRGKKHTVDKIQVFQLTSSRRGWLMTTLQLSLMLHFNSHPHEEDDRSRNNTICT